jgi:hypothetical protein
MQVDDYAEEDRREVNPPIEVESATCPRAARSIGGSKSGESGGVGYAVPTAAKGGSELLVFVRRMLSISSARRLHFEGDTQHANPLQSRNVETHADPAPAQAPCACAGRRSHRAAGRGTVPKGRGAALAYSCARRGYWRHPRLCPATGRGLSCHLAWPQERGRRMFRRAAPQSRVGGVQRFLIFWH